MGNTVKFYIGNSSDYDATEHEYGLYFTTDTNELFLNGSSIGNTIQTITYSTSGATLTMNNGDTYTINAASSAQAGLLTSSWYNVLSSLSAIAAANSSITISSDYQISVQISGQQPNLLELDSDGLVVGLPGIYSSDGSIISGSAVGSDIMSDTDININVNIDNSTIQLNEDSQLYVVNSLSDSEKTWIEEQLFDSLFSATITASPSSSVFSGASYTVTWTLTCTYDGTLVDLDSTPSGWTYSSTGTYTKTTTVSSSTGKSVSSGSVSCTYNGLSKTASSVSATNIKYSYIYVTTDSSLSSLDDIDYTTATQMSTTNTVAGTYTITFEDGQYAYFIIANTSSVSSITQLGLNYVNSSTSMTRTNYGTYTVYRSTNAMSAGSQDVTVA